MDTTDITQAGLEAPAKSAKDLELRRRIMDKAQEIFLQFGFSRVTMDELASELGMSKKTLYKHFSSKEDLVLNIIRGMCTAIDCQIDIFMRDEHTNSVEKLNKILSYVHNTLSKINTSMAQDVRRYMPDLWSEMERFRREHSERCVGALFQQGMDEGIFRSDIDRQISVMIYTTAVNNLINPSLLAELPYSASDVYRNFVRIFFEGFLTDKGRSELSVVKEKTKRKK